MTMRSNLNLLLVLALLLAFSGCRPDDPPPPDGGAPPAGAELQVVATFSILGDLVHQVGGEHIRLRTLVGPDGDAHTFQPSPKDSVMLHEARLVFENGLGFEGWLDDLFDASGSTAERIVVTRSIEAHRIDQADQPADRQGDQLEDEDRRDGHRHHEHHDHAEGDRHDESADGHDHEEREDDADGPHDHGHDHVEHTHAHHHGEFDPHAWHAVPHAIAMVSEIAEALAGADPANAASYQANRDRSISELRELDAWVRTQVDRIPAERRVLVTTHDTFGYFADQYGLRTVNVLGSVSSESSDPSAAAVARVVEQIKATGVPAVFAENILNPRLTEQIARQAGVRVVGPLLTDALGAADREGSSYTAMIRHNVQTIVEALQ
ncbi:MAG: zinc ABC transporter substrate-binding protein [Acidobacteriota bacterium]